MYGTFSTFNCPIFLGEKYLGAVSILQVMLISAILGFIIVPIEQAIYSLGKPMFITIGKYIQMGGIIILIFLTVPYFGVIWVQLVWYWHDYYIQQY